MIPVKRWMRTGVATVTPTTTVGDAARLMTRRRVRHLPVREPSGRLLGIVTDRDLRQVIFDAATRARLGHAVAGLERVPVREVMTWGVVTVRAEDDLRQAARLMRERKIGALPVVSRGRLVGMLTETDLLAALEKTLGERVAPVRPLDAKGGGEEYEYGFPPPPLDDLWRNEGRGD
jgi:acetoin utilization protein AcuB